MGLVIDHTLVIDTLFKKRQLHISEEYAENSHQTKKNCDYRVEPPPIQMDTNGILDTTIEEVLDATKKNYSN